MENSAECSPGNGLDIAVVGMSCRLPGAKNVDKFWQNLREGVESISFFPDQELIASGVDPAVLSDPNYVKAGAILEGIELFDSSFFGYNPREADVLDPQHRVFMECAWEALENAGYDPETYKGLIGIYAGVGMNTYLLNNINANPGLESAVGYQTVLGNDKDFLTTRVSYKFNLEGPSVVVQTACSTSLVAVHLACQGLLGGECDMALAGGVTIKVPQKVGYFYQEGGILSPDGHCRAFDARAQGCGPGSGAGIVVLKRLSDALADGDYIHAVIKGSTINNDGSFKVGYTAPGVEGQAKVIRATQVMAEIEAETISYIETHGTGTILGDPIEIAALTQAFRASTKAKGFCAIGSVKTNIGHLDTAAGVVALIKTVLALKHKLLPPSLHFEEPNPKIDFDNSPFYVNATLSDWKAERFPRRAGVSSFGIGGTNAHVILEEAPPVEVSGKSRPWQLLVLSAKTSSVLGTTTANLAGYLKQHPDVNLADIAHTLQRGRKAFSHRRILACQNFEDAVTALKTLDPKRVFTAAQEPRDRPIVFMFPGQGAQYVNMALELYQVESTVREQVDLCSELLKPHLGFDLRHVLYTSEEQIEEATQQLNSTPVAQPALFVIEYALAKLWMEWGLRPQAMIGHSIGEYVAACLAGVFSVEEALALVAARGRLMNQVPPGDMLAVPLPEREVQPFLGERLSLAAVNTPSLCVVSGPSEAVEALQNQLAEQGLEYHALHTSHAFHSQMMDPVLGPFTEQVKRVNLRPPKIPFLSNVSGRWIKASEATDSSYWVRHLRRTVRFSEGVQELLKEPQRILLEVGPGQTLSSLAKRQLDNDKTGALAVFSSTRHPRERQSDVAFLLNTLGQLWLAGIKVDWSGFYTRERRHRISLPTYPFEHHRHWVEPQKQTLDDDTSQVSLRKKPDIADWFYIPSWKRSATPKLFQQGDPVDQESRWLVFTDVCGLGSQLVKSLEENGQDVITVTAGEQFARLGDRAYTINPRQRNDYEALLTDLWPLDKTPKMIVHLWNVTANDQTQSGIESVEKFQYLGFYSLFFLAQALGNQNIWYPLQITVVTSNVHEVTGEEVLCPEKATVLGPCRVIPQEYSNITCRTVDIIVSQSKTSQDKKLIDQLMSELVGKSSDSVIAYRGNHRWVQTFEPIQLHEAVEDDTRLREGGVYLITGGLGGIGLVLAKYLARAVRPKLVLIGRTTFPKRDEWEKWLAEPINIDMEEERDYINRVEEKIERELGIKGITAYKGLEETLNKLCSSYIYDYLVTSGIDTKKGKNYDKQELKKTLKILPKFEKFYNFMVKVLLDDRIIKIKGNKLEFLKDKREIKHPQILRMEAEQKFLEFKGIFGLLEHCVNHYGKALTGEIPAISVLYPDGSTSLMRDCEEILFEHSNSRIYQMLVSEVTSQIVKKSQDRTIRILEVGAGDGILTKQIISALEDQNIEYFFTDIGKSFVRDAEKEASKAGLDFMKFGVFDISKDPTEQGYEKNSFDIILGLNVVHATKNIRETIGNLKGLLVSNGIICLIETVKLQRWIDMVWGLAEGWWYFEDMDIRRGSPLLSLRKWEEVLQKQGFRSVRTYPQNEEKRLETDTGLIIAQNRAKFITIDSLDSIPEVNNNKRKIIQGKIRKLKELEDLGAEVHVVSADVANLEQMQAVKAETFERFGTIHGVIHAALVLNDGTIQLKAPEIAASVLSPKVRGTLVMDGLFKDVKLDFFVLFSSLSSILGGIGQVDYCGASAFLDAFAHHNVSRNGTFTVSINWGAWRQVGMALRAAVKRNQKPEEALKEGMSSKEGVEAFRRILCSGTLPQVLVSTQDLLAMIHQSRSHASTKSMEETEEPPLPKPEHPRSQQAEPYVAPRNEVEKIIADIWQEVLGIEQVSIHDNFFEMGGDSVIGLQIIAKANQAGLRFTNKQVFEHQTIAELAAIADTSKAIQSEQDVIHRQSPGVGKCTPSDFPGARLSQKDLDEFVARISQCGGRRPK